MYSGCPSELNKLVIGNHFFRTPPDHFSEETRQTIQDTSNSCNRQGLIGGSEDIWAALSLRMSIIWLRDISNYLQAA